MQLGVDFIKALRQMIQDKDLSEDVVIASLKAALASAYRKYRDDGLDPEVEIDRETGEVTMSEVYHVTDDPIEEGDVTLEEAQKMGFADAHLGDELRVPIYVRPEQFGRIAAQTARQVIIQRLKDAEREVAYNEFSEKVGDLVSGEIFKIENDLVFVKLNERIEAILGKEERIPGEEYLPGKRMRFYLLDVRPSTRGPRIYVSRTHPGLVRRLLELTVPEVREGYVEIRGLVREPGIRTKVAVSSFSTEIDPVGACIGGGSGRIRDVINELGEKVDIIEYHEDLPVYVANALGPARSLSVDVDPEGDRYVTVTVAPDQLSLAIGRSGVNARLAAKLCGCRIDIVPAKDSAGVEDR